MKVHVIKRGINESDWENRYSNAKIEITYCGYLEVESPFNANLWHLCNWSCWNYVKGSDEAVKPKECENLYLTHCNSDVAFCIDGVWYSHSMHKFNSFEECYEDMVCGKWADHFHALYTHDEGLDGYELQFVTPDNINDFIK